MPPKKKNKNQPRNAFYFYMVSLRPELQRQGVVLENGMQSLSEIAGPRWKELSEHEKEVYQEMARHAKANRQYAPPRNDRRDCTGQLVSERVDVVTVNEIKRRRQRDEVKSAWPPGKLVCDEHFYLIGFMSLLGPLEDVQLPCELGVAEFSINNGIIRSMHRFIKPGDIPLGYRYQCISNSESSHQIPITGLANEGDTYYTIFTDLMAFLDPHGTNAFPPVYCRASETTQTETCLNWLAKNAGMPNRFKKVYELEGLICDLFSHIKTNEGALAKTQATEVISSTTFDYEKGARCDWHENQEVRFCALGTVKRHCFCMADFLCPHYDIPFTVSHLPERPEGTFGTVLNEVSNPTNTRQDYEANDYASTVYSQRQSYGRGYPADDHTYNQRRSGPTYEAGSLETSTDNATSWSQRVNNEEALNHQPPSYGVNTGQSNQFQLPLGRSRGRGRGLPFANRPGAPGNTAPSGVSRGRGLRIPNTRPKVYAGSASAPHPSAAPAPPVAWQQIGEQQTNRQHPQQERQQQRSVREYNTYSQGYSQQTAPYQGQRPQQQQQQRQWQQPQQQQQQWQQQRQWQQRHMQQPSHQYYDDDDDEYDNNYYEDARPARHGNPGVYGMDSIEGVMNMMSNMRTVSN